MLRTAGFVLQGYRHRECVLQAKQKKKKKRKRKEKVEETKHQKSTVLVTRSLGKPEPDLGRRRVDRHAMPTNTPSTNFTTDPVIITRRRRYRLAGFSTQIPNYTPNQDYTHDGGRNHQHKNPADPLPVHQSVGLHRRYHQQVHRRQIGHDHIRDTHLLPFSAALSLSLTRAHTQTLSRILSLTRIVGENICSSRILVDWDEVLNLFFLGMLLIL